MPPIRSQSSRDSIEQEGRILLAIQAIKNQDTPQFVKQHAVLAYLVQLSKIDYTATKTEAKRVLTAIN